MWFSLWGTASYSIHSFWGTSQSIAQYPGFHDYWCQQFAFLPFFKVLHTLSSILLQLFVHYKFCCSLVPLVNAFSLAWVRPFACWLRVPSHRNERLVHNAQQFFCFLAPVLLSPEKRGNQKKFSSFCKQRRWHLLMTFLIRFTQRKTVFSRISLKVFGSGQTKPVPQISK